jgi:3',5'-cyclic AMP phosphodiesterase CpdA
LIHSLYQVPAMSLFRILHASDLHFAAVPHQIGIPDLLHAWRGNLPGSWAATSSQGSIQVDAFAAFAHANRAALDLLVLSGDLATTGGLRNLRAAQAFLESPVVAGYLDRRNRPTLQGLGKPIVLIPGNHDRFRRFHFPGGQHFDAVFSAHWSAGQGAQELWVRQRGGETLVLLGVDLSLRKHDLGSHPLGFLGRGRAYRNRLARLSSLTQQARSRYPGCVVVWIIHFEPEAQNPLLGLLDERYLGAALQQTPADAILCGHTHESNSTKMFAGVPVFVCGTTTQHASMHGNTLHVLDVSVQTRSGSPQFSCRVFRYDPAVGQFV